MARDSLAPAGENWSLTAQMCAGDDRDSAVRRSGVVELRTVRHAEVVVRPLRVCGAGGAGWEPWAGVTATGDRMISSNMTGRIEVVTMLVRRASAFCPAGRTLVSLRLVVQEAGGMVWVRLKSARTLLHLVSQPPGVHLAWSQQLG